MIISETFIDRFLNIFSIIFLLNSRIIASFYN